MDKLAITLTPADLEYISQPVADLLWQAIQEFNQEADKWEILPGLCQLQVDRIEKLVRLQAPEILYATEIRLLGQKTARLKAGWPLGHQIN